MHVDLELQGNIVTAVCMGSGTMDQLDARDVTVKDTVTVRLEIACQHPPSLQIIAQLSDVTNVSGT